MKHEYEPFQSLEDARNHLMVALDMDGAQQAVQLAEQLHGQVRWVKVGMELFYSGGYPVIQALKDQGKHIFLDLKFHDIPHTVAQASRAAVRMGATMFNVHACGGRAMMREAVQAARSEADRQHVAKPLLIAVTVLTSLDQQTFENEIGFSGQIRDRVLRWALLAQQAGMDGVVASAREAEEIRNVCGPDFLIVTPGIRPAGSHRDDQVRVMDPASALAAGAHYLVVGRPITQAADPVKAASEILAQMTRGNSETGG